MGLGETMEDRIDMYMDIAALGIKSMPVNFLTPIPGTPYADMTPLGEEEQLRIVALVRFIMPDGFVRIAAGRNTMKDHVRSECRHLRRYAHHRRRHHPGRPGHAGGTGI